MMLTGQLLWGLVTMLDQSLLVRTSVHPEEGASTSHGSVHMNLDSHFTASCTQSVKLKINLVKAAAQVQLLAFRKLRTGI